MFSVVNSGASNRFKEDVSLCVAYGEMIDGITGEHDGVQVKLAERNVKAAIAQVVVGNIRSTLLRPNDAMDSVRIDFGNDSNLTVYELPNRPDDPALLMRFDYEGKVSYFFLRSNSGFSWLCRAVSPEGYLDPNERID